MKKMTAIFILLLLSAVSLCAALMPVQTGSYFRVDDLLADELRTVDSGGGAVFRADIRQTPLVEPRRRIVQPARQSRSLGVSVSPRGRALESMRAAEVFAESQDWRQALSAIQKGLDLEPDNLLLVRRAAAYAAMARRFGVADEYFRRALEATPDDVPFLAGRAGILLRLLRLNEAEELADRAMALSPGYLAARFTKTCVQIARGDAELDGTAWETMTTSEAVQLAEWMDADRADYIAVLSSAGFNQLCESILGPGTSENLSDISRLLKRTQYAQRMGRWGEAIEALQKTQELGVQSVGLALDMARIRFELGEEDEAEEMLRELAGRFPDEALVLYDHAVALVRMNRFDEAQKVLETAHEKDPSVPQVIFGLACTHAAQGDMTRAWRVLNRLAPGDRPQLRVWTQGEESYIRAIREDPRFEDFVGSTSGS